MKKKLVIFDGNALLHRAFHALPPLTSKDGEQINALYGLISMLLNVIENLRPTHILFCFDEKGKTFRNKLLPTYQAQRPEVSNDLIIQFSKARDFLNSVNIPFYSMEGYEADDVIGTIATKVSKLKFETIVVTGDRDILQIVDDKKDIKLFMPIAGLSNGKLFRELETIERMGVKPLQISDYKALVGDASDNYFGISGIGPKTAINLLEKYDTLDGIYKHLNDLPDRLKEKLEKGKESAYLSYKLARIDINVPIKYNIEDADKWDLYSVKAQEFYTSYGFKTLPLRIRKFSEKLEQEKQGNLF